jgi:carbamoyltransferase
MIILGIYGCCGWDPEDAWLHASGASLWKDGEHQFSISEERLSRRKYDGRYPRRSIRYVLEHADIDQEDVDVVVYAHNLHSVSQEKDVEAILQRYFKEAKIKFIDHHHAHIAAAVYTSGFNDCNFLSLDGAGNSIPTACDHQAYETGAVGFYKKSTGIYIVDHAINGLMKEKIFNLGQVYNDISRFVYMQMQEDYEPDNVHEFMEAAPGKVMGLSAYGSHNEVDLGHIWSLTSPPYSVSIKDNKMPTEKMLGVYEAKDLAAWLQHEFEHILVEYFKAIPKELKKNNLCIAGGCGLNVLANRRLLDEGLFNNIHVFPGANDSGLCFGAAINEAVEDVGIKKLKLPKNLGVLGCEYTEEDIEEVLKDD